jgi:hypothetical protein
MNLLSKIRTKNHDLLVPEDHSEPLSADANDFPVRLLGS